MCLILVGPNVFYCRVCIQVTGDLLPGLYEPVSVSTKPEASN